MKVVKSKPKNAKEAFEQILRQTIVVPAPFQQEGSDFVVEITVEQAIGIAMAKEAMAGGVQAATFLFDRVYGKPKSTNEVDINDAHNLRYRSEEELKKMLLDLQQSVDTTFEDVKDDKDV